METLFQTVAENIAELRAKAGLSQLSLATEANISLKTLYELERGNGNLQLNTLTKIANALGVPPVRLFEGSSDSPELDALINLLSGISK